MDIKKTKKVILSLIKEPTELNLLEIEKEFDFVEKIDIGNPDGGDDILQKYINAIKVKSLLTREDEISLAKKIAKGGSESKKATKKFIDSNLLLVVKVARKYSQERHLKFLDCIQEGNIGLIEAVRRYEWQKGFKFSTYAIWWIRQSISIAIKNDDRTIRLPVHATEKIHRFLKKQSVLCKKLGRSATILELALFLKLGESEILEILEQSRHCLSLNQERSNESDEEIQDFIPSTTSPSPEKSFEDEDFKRRFRKSLKQALKNFSRKERTIFVSIFLRSLSPRQVAKKMDISHDKVLGIEKRIKLELRDKLKKFN